MKYNYIAFISFLTFSIHSVSGNLDSMLRYYEKLGSEDITIYSISKRSASGKTSSLIKEVTYKAFSRTFHLVLKNSREILHPQFEVTSVDAYGNERPVFINQNDFYTGYVKGEYNSHVDAYWGDGLMTTNIRTSHNEFTIEPSWRHLPGDKNVTMIAYRASDVKPDLHGRLPTSYCGAIHPKGDNAASRGDVPYSHTSDVHHAIVPLTNASYGGYSHRQKRAVTGLNACPMMLVADHTFFKAIGQSSTVRTAKYLAHQLQKINAIFSKTQFGDFGGMQVEMKKIRVHESANTGSQTHYNMVKSKWVPLQLLQQFSKTITTTDYCLAHLFTHQSFDKGVLGLAYIASPQLGALGGVCTRSYITDRVEHYLNTGFSSSKNSFGDTLISQQAYLVTAHEIGHNWGSEHDSGDTSCLPSSENGGKYLMYPYAVAGYDTNNLLFSPCSIEFIKKVLQFKHHLCFKEKATSFCGNGFVDPDSGEQCDAGVVSGGKADACCTHACRFKTGAICSAENDPCCSNTCQVKAKGSVCFLADVDDTSCLHDAKCNGVRAGCPPRSPKADGTACGDNGKCKDGKCQSYCELLNMKPCACDGDANSCKWCCMAAGDKCKPHGDKILTDGRPCVRGYCEKGVCQKTDKNLIVRLWDIIDKITSDKIVEFMRANIVGTVIVLSLIIWIPGSITISCLDKRRAKKEKERREWRSVGNPLLIRPREANTFKLKDVPAYRVRSHGDTNVHDPSTFSPSIDTEPARSTVI